jgi:hypothetical protein
VKKIGRRKCFFLKNKNKNKITVREDTALPKISGIGEHLEHLLQVGFGGVFPTFR